ncbi:MBL fold metallo-hydrolase RNA specificity domain-containing protein [Lacisediminihabitans sp.]|uniref:MBL fold metallo-hydrolase RNA specificity domain-containing protein n=1 Tax=Lacisediminihabitans sp. TaxID=2787631 RepID=UPI00374D17F0
MTSDAATLRFLGATQTVTGSRYLVSVGGASVLVDCGMFQGYKQLRDRNRLPFPVDPASIDAVVLTHAHLDHSGYLPALVRDGFAGPIYATSGTAELCSLVLVDSGHLLEEEARYAQRRGSSKHHPPRPIYTVKDAERALESFRVTPFDQEFAIADRLSATLVPAGHILGAAQVALDAGGARVHFTGDLGRRSDPLMREPRALGAVDVLVTESTYGDRDHPPVDPEAQLGEIVTRVASRGGVVLIPSFAVGRAESLLLHLSRLRAKGAIPDIPIYLNSPMAVDASLIYQRHEDEHRVSPAEFDAMYSIARLVQTVDDSKLLNLRGGPMIIISASGMLTGGRILHHIAAYGSDAKNAIVLSGFQAGGTRGAALARGETTLRIFGQDVPILAEVVQVESLSAHADRGELIDWMRTAPRAPSMTYITHGEPDAADELRARIKRTLGWPARVPEYLETVSLAEPR